MARYCVVCTAEAKHRCSVCKAVFYCSQSCQRSNWSAHKPLCMGPHETRHLPERIRGFPHPGFVRPPLPPNAAPLVTPPMSPPPPPPPVPASPLSPYHSAMSTPSHSTSTSTSTSTSSSSSTLHWPSPLSPSASSAFLAPPPTASSTSSTSSTTTAAASSSSPIPSSSSSSSSYPFPPTPSAPRYNNLLILLHGLGDTEKPFTALATTMALPETACISLRAPLALPFDLGYGWYDCLESDGTEIVPRSDELRRLNSLDATRRRLHEMFDSLCSCGWTLDRVFLLGFGQGGVAALDAALSAPQPLRAVIAVSSGCCLEESVEMARTAATATATAAAAAAAAAKSASSSLSSTSLSTPSSPLSPSGSLSSSAADSASASTSTSSSVAASATPSSNTADSPEPTITIVNLSQSSSSSLSNNQHQHQHHHHHHHHQHHHVKKISNDDLGSALAQRRAWRQRGTHVFVNQGTRDAGKLATAREQVDILSAWLQEGHVQYKEYDKGEVMLSSPEEMKDLYQFLSPLMHLAQPTMKGMEGVVEISPDELQKMSV